MEQVHYEKGAEYPELGPQYFAARDIAQAFMEKFSAEQFEPLLKRFSEEFYCKAKDDFETYLMSDAESNIHNSIRYLLDDTVKALLTGKEWALERYPLAKYHDGEEMRKAIAAHIPLEIQNKRIEELEAEVKRLKESLHWHTHR